MKAHRKVCNEKGCVHDPKYKSIFCEAHSFKSNRELNDDNTQQLLNDDEFHVEKIPSKWLDKKVINGFT